MANMRLGNAMTIAGANYLYMIPWYALGWIFFDVYRPEDGSIPEDAEELQEDPDQPESEDIQPDEQQEEVVE